MRKLKMFKHISLDGVIQVRGSGEEDYVYGEWTVPYRTPAGRDAILAAYGESFDLLLGRRTYDLWSGFWPKAPSSPVSDRLNAATKYVATHRPESLEWGPFEGVGPNIVGDTRRIKSHDGPNLILCGSSTLTSTLAGGAPFRSQENVGAPPFPALGKGGNHEYQSNSGAASGTAATAQVRKSSARADQFFSRTCEIVGS